MTISVEQIQKLIEDYWGYEREWAKREDDPVAFGRATLYRTVIMDLEKLLPRESMADIPPEEWPDYVGTWVEHGECKYVMIGSQNSLGIDVLSLFYPAETRMRVADPDEVFPLDTIDRAWDSEGNPT